jgi:serine/threonine-protein kinase
MSSKSLPPSTETPSSGPRPALDVALWGDSDVGGSRARARNDKPGDPLATIGHIGRYALKYRIGEGGLGTVYAAHDPLLSRLIAIKTLNLEISAEQRSAFNALFLNEARAAASLSHPNIVTVFDAGVSDNKAYIAMELLKGRDLRQLRQAGWRPTPAQAALIVRRVADALAYAHNKGVVHRDVKPANIFMVGRTQPRVLDFGIARVAHQHDAHAGDEVAAGSPYYMAPEQVRQEAGDRRTDVFSLGVVLYELLTDEKPFRGSTLDDITNAVLGYVPPLANTVNKDVPKALAHIAARAMEKDPEHRYRSARALSRELRHWLEEHGGDAEASESNWTSGRRLATIGIAGAAVAAAAAAWWRLAPDQGNEPVPVHAEAAAASAQPASGALPAAAPPAAQAVADPGAATGASAPSAAPATPAAPVPAEADAPTAGKPVALREQPKGAAAPQPKETARERRAREAREQRQARGAAPAAPAVGSVRLAISPWGQIEVDGASIGSAPPLTEIKLPEGKHQIVIRNGDFPPYTANVGISGGAPVVIKHRFGS